MLDATSLPRGYAVRCNVVAIRYSTVQLKSHLDYLTPDVASLVGNAFGLYSWDCWFEPTVHHDFSSNNVHLLAYTSLHVQTHSFLFTF